MVLAVLPIFYIHYATAAMEGAVGSGDLFCALGGLAPLVVPNLTMVTAQRYQHVGEILTQNFGSE